MFDGRDDLAEQETERFVRRGKDMRSDICTKQTVRHNDPGNKLPCHCRLLGLLILSGLRKVFVAKHFMLY